MKPRYFLAAAFFLAVPLIAAGPSTPAPFRPPGVPAPPNGPGIDSRNPPQRSQGGAVEPTPTPQIFKASGAADIEITIQDSGKKSAIKITSSLPLRRVLMYNRLEHSELAALDVEDDPELSFEIPYPITPGTLFRIDLNIGYFDGKQRIETMEIDLDKPQKPEVKKDEAAKEESEEKTEEKTDLKKK